MVISKRGFTLIELLVAISIIATLTAIVLPNFMGARERARDAQKKEDMYAIKNALRMVYNDNQTYPVDKDEMLDLVPTYMPNIANIGYDYDYAQIDSGDGFQLCVEMEASNTDDNFDSQGRCEYSGHVCGVLTNENSAYYVICAN